MIKKITIIGSGNVATHLGKTLLNKGFSIVQVYSKSIDNAIKLAATLNAIPCDNIKLITNKSDLYLVCIKDDAIDFLLKQFPFKDKIISHTSGSVSIAIFKKNNFQNYGIFYPLQTFSKTTEVNISEVPFCIEANNESTQKILLNSAKKISNSVYEINSEQRKKIHLAAVFACNFSNYMYTISENILAKSNLNFDILKPLILETAKKIKHNSPIQTQTGPAKRNDKEVIKEHLKLLSNTKDYQKIYQLISESICSDIK